MIANRTIDRPTNRQTDRHTDTLIAILRPPTRAKLISESSLMLSIGFDIVVCYRFL